MNSQHTDNNHTSRNTFGSLSKIQGGQFTTNPSNISLVGYNQESKKLVPLVSDNQKNDIYSKLQTEENRRKREEKEKKSLVKQDHSKERSVVQNTRSDKSFPRLDNKNPGYTSAFLKQPKNFDIEKGIPSFTNVKSSNYGKIEKRNTKNGSNSTIFLLRYFSISIKTRRCQRSCG